MHISFNWDQDIPIEDIANGVAEKSNDTSEDKVIFGIKNFGWSEDHFGIDTRILSNSQFRSHRLQPNDYDVVGD